MATLKCISEVKTHKKKEKKFLSWILDTNIYTWSIQETHFVPKTGFDTTITSPVNLYMLFQTLLADVFILLKKFKYRGS